MDSDEKIIKEWIDKSGNKLKLCWVNGKYKFINYPDKQDKLLYIKINESEPFFIKHEQQIDIMKTILGNDILPHRLMENIEKFLSALYELKGEKKLEYRRYNVKLSEFANRNLWNCGGENETA